MSELFGPHDTLILYSFMYGPERDLPCPGCTHLLDGIDGAARHVGDRASLHIVAKSPIARLAAWESPIVDLGAPVGLDAITWAGRAPAGAVSARVRTCEQEAECASAPWSDPVTVSGTKPAYLARRFAQLAIELTSDGDLTPSVDWIELGYRSAGQ
jgi:hypothetical protein